MRIHLDVTRILSRSAAPSPTGIDRVELEYAKHVLADGGHFVVQIGDCLALAPRWLTEQVVGHLDKRWSQGGDHDQELDERVKRWRKQVRVPRPVSNIDKFFRSLEGKRFSARLKITRSERAYMAKKAPIVPAGISAIAVAAVPFLFKKALTSDHKSSAKVLFSPVSLSNVYLNVGHTGLEKDRLLGNLKKNPNWKTAIYVHDVLPITHPHLFVDGTKQKHDVRMRNVVKFSDIVFANSHFTAEETERLYKRKVDAVLEIGSEASTRVPSHLGERTGFVSIGTVEPRKNYLWLVTSWISFCKKYPDIVKGEKLNIFGASGWLNGSNLERLKEEIESSSNVEMIHGASDEDVVAELKRSRAYLTAAEVEGWGMPLAESLSLGTPVICSDVKAHREVTRGKASFFEFNNEEELHALLLKSYTDGAEEMAETASQFEPWLWESHFARLKSLSQSF